MENMGPMGPMGPRPISANMGPMGPGPWAHIGQHGPHGTQGLGPISENMLWTHKLQTWVQKGVRKTNVGPKSSRHGSRKQTLDPKAPDMGPENGPRGATAATTTAEEFSAKARPGIPTHPGIK